MFAGDGATEADRQVHDVAESLVSPRRHRGVVGVVDDQRVGVSVTGVGDHRDHQPGVGGDLRHPAHQVGQFGHWYAHILE